MAFALHIDPLPLYESSPGAWRFIGTRVSLESVLYMHQAGASVEEIAEGYPSVAKEHIHAVITYMLWNPGEAERLLAEYEGASTDAREQFEAQPSALLSEKLLKRRILTLLERGPLSADELAAEMNKPEERVSDLLGSLTGEGLVSVDMMHGKMRYRRAA